MCKQKKSIESRIEKRLDELAAKYDVKNLSFQYYKRIFGNIVVEIETRKGEFVFILDRGDIIFNCKFFNDGITQTIQFMYKDSYQQKPHIQLLTFIGEMLEQYSE